MVYLSKMRLISRSVCKTFSEHARCCLLQNSLLKPTSVFVKNRYKMMARKHNFSLSSLILREEGPLKDVSDQNDTETKAYEEIVSRVFHTSEMGHQVLVIQPYIKWGSKKKRNTNPDLQLAEAVALVGTLRHWKVVDKIKISLTSLEKKTFFGSGNLELLKDKIQKNRQITAVFLSTDMLHGVQHRELEAKFKVPVYDRYMLVIQIFREHAVSKEAKLQVALAEIPYLRMKIKGLSESVDHQGAGVAAIGGSGETYVEVRRRIVATREIKLKKMLEKLRNQRTLLRTKRKKLEYPVVAVVGYTNAGKTSLIKSLTGETSMVPKDYLFATLDVTAHAGILPCNLQVLYIDTVGFISDIPTHLIESFMATLEDALNADIIIHVCDISHPDHVAQMDTVNNILQSLNLSSELLDNVLVVGNKVDLLPENKVEDYNDNKMLISTVTNEGICELQGSIEKRILDATGRISTTIRVPMGGDEMKWLYKFAVVTKMIPDPKSSQHLLLGVVITKSQLNKFKHDFIRETL